MNEDFLPGVSGRSEAGTNRELDTLGSSTLFKLCEEVIALREYDKRQLRSLEQTLNKVRDELKTSFNSFAADTQRAYQQLRQETHGEKRVSLTLLNELLETAHDLKAIVAARPMLDDAEARRALDRGHRGRIAQGGCGLAQTRHPTLRRRH